MPKPVIKVEALSKAYRIGVADEKHETLAATVASWVKAPFRNLQRLSRLNTASSLPLENSAFSSSDIHWALRDISFDIGEGEVVGIIGRNGAGKSTLLKILSRITDPTSGRATIYGRVSSLLEVGTGFHPELSGRENVYMNGTILGMRKKEIDRKFDEIVAFSGVEKFIDTPVKRYSSGMKVRLAFAVAAHLEPEILIIDEVLAVGDQEFQNRCLGKMEDVSRSGRTVLFVSHNMGAVRNLCTRSVLLRHGQVASNGDTNSVIEEYLQSTKLMEENPTFRREVLDHERPFQITEVVLSSTLEGKPRSHFDCDDNILIRVRFTSARVVTAMYGYLSIHKSDGTLVLESDSCDSGINPLCSSLENKGQFHICIPPRQLAPGRYQVQLSFHSRQDPAGFDIDVAGTVGEFELTDTSTIRGNRRRGFMSIRLPWTLTPNCRSES